jgi:NTE family protein
MYYGRGDYLADYFDRTLFEGKTFADLPRRRPFIRIGATDMIDGKRVEFTQDSFDDLCSELGPVPIARAVAASAAVPGVFSPVNVADYSDYGQCPGDPEPRRYRHLIDGGVVDNLGISGPLQAIGRYDGLVKTMRRFGFRGIRNYAIVVLNVESDPRDPHDGEPRVPGLWRTVNAAINGNLRMDSQALAASLRQRVVDWQHQIASDPDAVRSGVFATPTPNIFLIEIGFDKVVDPALRARLQSIPTALRLAPADETLLADFVRDALRDSVEYQALLATLADEAEHGPPPVSPLLPAVRPEGGDPDVYKTLDGEKPASDALRPDAASPDAHPEPPR